MLRLQISYSVCVPKNYENWMTVDKVIAESIWLTFLAHPVGSDRRPETKQGIEGKIVGFRSGRVRDRVRVRDN